MTRNVVNVTFTATDLLSSRLAGIKANLGGLSSSIRQADLGISSFMGNLSANLASMGIQQAIQGFQGLTQAVQGAADLQTKVLSQAGDLAQQLKINFGKAKDVVKETQKALSGIAVDLPGEDQDYQAAFGQLSGISAKLANGDIGAFKEISINLAKRTALLASIQGSDSGTGGMAVSQFISGGKGLGELFQIDLFQKSSVLRDSIDEQLKTLGKSRSDFQSLNISQREKIVTKALSVAVPQEVLDASKGTVSAQLAGIRSALFNPQTGLFGFLKEIKAAGNRTALDSIQGFLQSWGNLTESMGNIGAKLGITFDPMLALVRVVDWFTDLGNLTNGFLNGGNLDSFNGLFNQLGNLLPNLINNALKGFENIVNNTNWLAVGAGLNRLGTAIWKGLWGIDWGLVARLLFKILVVAPVGLIGGAIANAASDIVSMVTGAFKGIGSWLVEGFQNTFTSIFESLKNILRIDVGQMFNKALGAKESPGAPSKSLTDSSTPRMSLTIPTPPSSSGKPQMVSYNPSFQITAPEGSDPTKLVDLIRSTIGNDWKSWENNQLA